MKKIRESTLVDDQVTQVTENKQNTTNFHSCSLN